MEGRRGKTFLWRGGGARLSYGGEEGQDFLMEGRRGKTFTSLVSLATSSLPYYCTIIRALKTVRVAKVKYVVWSPDMSHVALLGRNGEVHSKWCPSVIDVCAPPISPGDLQSQAADGVHCERECEGEECRVG